MLRSYHRFALLKRHFAAVIAAAVVMAIVAGAPSTAQEENTQAPAAGAAQTQGQAPVEAPEPAPQPSRATAPQAPAGERERRIEEIERALRDLLREVQSLRAPAPATATQPTARTPAAEQKPIVLPAEWMKTLAWRAIGPANMGGRIVDFAVYEADPSIFWVATASGGLLKTTNNGTTFEHQFDKQATVSLGAVAVAPSDASIVWVGTGEYNPRNSVSYGDGVYKSTDGGKSWKNMGLKKSFQIGDIVIHPKDPNIVYVGALGRLYGNNEERGVFKTTNGGETWEKVLFIDDKTGIIDVRMSPADPEILIAAAWERQRDGFDSWPGSEVPVPDGYNGYDPIKKWGPGSGLYKTADGGKTWKKLTEGLPTSNTGRIGLDWYRKDPNVVFAVIDCEDTGKGPAPINVFLGAVGKDVDGKAILTQVVPASPADKAGMKVGDVISAVGEKAISGFDQVLDELRGKRPGQKVKITTLRGEEKQELEIALSGRPGQGGVAAGGGVWLGAAGENREGKAFITFLMQGGPAATAGIQEGDAIVSVEGKPLDDYSQLTEQLRSRQAGDKVKLVIARGEEKKEVTVTLEERPSFGRGGGGFGRFGGGSQSDVYLGIQGEDAEGGARLTVITPDGPAEKANLEVGDIVKAIDGKAIAGYEALTDEIRSHRAGDAIKLTIVRGGETKEMAATLATRAGASRTRPYGFQYGGQSPNVQDQQGAKGHLYGGIYKSTDCGETWTRINSLNPRPMYFSNVKVDPSDDNYVFLLGISQHRSKDGGATFDADFGRQVHADGHAIWVDPRDGRHILIGTDGGTYVTYDRGANWDHLNHMAIGQFYHVAISQKQPYRVVGGLQDNGSWLGPTLAQNGGGPINEDWISVGGGDGFMCRVDPDEPDLVYYTSQDGNMGRRNLRTGEQASIRPQRVRGAPAYRFNWNTPYILSGRNSRILYAAGNCVFRSLNRGDDLQAISPEITLTKRGSATALAESPTNPDLLYVGTDDGGL
ncbi:MAG: PDZ domain-containing protein, partial [Planctomycetia bacterium]|nr:PDZ domain-containing protein [Planctomycetia bacterium]